MGAWCSPFNFQRFGGDGLVARWSASCMVLATTDHFQDLRLTTSLFTSPLLPLTAPLATAGCDCGLGGIRAEHRLR